MRGLPVIAGTMCCLLAPPTCFIALADEPLPRSVLVIDQFELASPASAKLLSSLRSTLKSDPAAPISIYIENLDLGRFRDARFTDIVHTYLREKYRDKPIGVVAAVGSTALELVLALDARLWAGTPIIFTAVDDGTLDSSTLPANVTGITTPAPLGDSAAVARAIVPRLARLAIVGDPPERQFIRRQVPAQLARLASEFEIIDLTRLRMADLMQRVASLPADSAIIYIGLTLDADNVAYTSNDALTALAKVANRPIIVQADTHVGTGALGGIVADVETMGREAAEVALRVLAGVAPASIPVTTGHSMKPVFDGRQLTRWNVSNSQLPPGSEVRFQAPTMWEQYKEYVLLAATLCLLQLILILLLLAHRTRLQRANTDRRRAEDAAHALSGRLIEAQEQERARLARELHDDVTQRLALLAIEAGQEERKQSNPAMRKVREGLVRLSEDVHALSYRLHPAILEDLGLIEALRSECERFSHTCSFRPEAGVKDLPDKLPRDVSLCLFRIAQEGLRNIARHAEASRAEVCLRRLDGGLQLAITDNGVGFDPEKSHGRASLGQASMRQRVFFLGGSIDIDSAPGRGTQLRAWVPLKEAQLEPSARATG